MIDLTPLINAAILVLAALAMRYLVPWIRSKTTAEQREDLLFWAGIAVDAAQQLFYQSDGATRLEYALKYLADKGFDVEDEAVRGIVEAKVLRLHQALED